MESGSSSLNTPNCSPLQSSIKSPLASSEKKKEKSPAKEFITQSNLDTPCLKFRVPTVITEGKAKRFVISLVLPAASSTQRQDLIKFKELLSKDENDIKVIPPEKITKDVIKKKL